jgi:putative transposase
MSQYRQTSHSVFECTYHIVWITKYRYPILIGDIGNRARELIQRICRDNQVEIIRGRVARDHVHLHLSIPPYLSVSKLVQYLKGVTSRKIQQEFPELSKEVLGQAFMGDWIFCE